MLLCRMIFLMKNISSWIANPLQTQDSDQLFFEPILGIAGGTMNKGKVGNKQFISGRVIDSFFVKDQLQNGLGWMMDTTDSFLKDGPEGTFGHTGFTGTSIMVIPKYNVSIILLINRQNMGLLKSGYYYNVNPVRSQIFESTLRCYQ